MSFEHLKKVPLFADFSTEELNMLAALVVNQRYRKKMIIFMEGETGTGVHFVKSGTVKIYKISEDGREQILHFLREGDVFAEVVVIDGGPYPASAEAVEDSEIGILRNQDLEKLLLTNPKLGIKLLNVLGKKLREGLVALRNMALKDSLGRVVSTILQLAQEHGEQTEAGVIINLGLSRQDLANYVGTTRETVTRIVTDLKKAKVIDSVGKQIIILDQERLEKWV